MSTKEEYNLSRPRIACPHCGRGITKACYDRHVSVCLKNQSKIQKESYRLDHDGLNCKFCGKLCKSTNSLIQHEIRCKDNPERRSFNTLAQYSTKHFKGQTKETNSVIAKQANTLKSLYDSGALISPAKGKPGSFLGRHHTEKTKASIGKNVSISRKAGYASGSIVPAPGVGRGKYSYIVTDKHRYMLRSTYEFILAVYLLVVEHVEFELESVKVPALRPNSYAETFISDFVVDGKTVIEVKGIPSGKDYYIKESFEAAGYEFIELFEDSIQRIKQKLIENNIDIESLLKNVIDGHNSKNYFIYDISSSVKSC